MENRRGRVTPRPLIGGGVVFILHEFVHCYQAECCEIELKKGLRIAREYWERGDYPWELEHPFPYEDGRFVELYSACSAENWKESLR
ncbi:hypothetical protein JCM16307_09840 [Thermococcus prieurii]